jgi:UDP-N-acetylglucosamine--N-acetylmuramyl-(pentapeptide) pyrophosphoryl-undecaprenol N-acetylglucosamine transferase
MATGRCLQERGHDVTLWLGAREVEGLSTGDWEGSVVRVKASGFAAGRYARWLGTALGLLLTCARSRRIMRRSRPDVVLAMGSYASIGPVLAAAMLGVPVVLHEANATPGRAVIFLARHADVLALAYESARPFFKGCFVELTGFPLREGLASRPPLEGLPTDVFTVLVMGGSQGAHALNELAKEGLPQLWARGRRFQVVHLSGRADEADTRQAYEDAGIPHAVFAFLDDMGRAYSSADLAVSRAGAAACAELTL